LPLKTAKYEVLTLFWVREIYQGDLDENKRIILKRSLNL
jgi:hypothetical protein